MLDTGYYKRHLYYYGGFLVSIALLYHTIYQTLVFHYNNSELQTVWVWTFHQVQVTFGLDGLNLLLVLLTTLVFPITMVVRENNVIKGEAIGSLFFLQILLILIFCTQNLLVFFILFELTLVPMYLLLIYLNGRYKSKRFEAGYRLYLYTFGGSLLFLMVILMWYVAYGCLDYDFLTIRVTQQHSLLWLILFIAFAIKVPMMPFHLWLPEAHTESPTIGSILLAALLLKVGVYAIVKFNLTLFQLLPQLISFYSPLILLSSLLSILYCSWHIIRLIDIKRIIAYSSILHMNYTIFGLLTNQLDGLRGGYISLFTHGLISGGLFLLIGILYRRYHTRNLLYYRGLFSVMPIWSVSFLILNLANISFPLTGGFTPEFLTLIGVYHSYSLVGLILCGFLFFITLFTFWLVNRILFGTLSVTLLLARDLTLLETCTLGPWVVVILFLGLYPYTLITPLTISLSTLISYTYLIWPYWLYSSDLPELNWTVLTVYLV